MCASGRGEAGSQVAVLSVVGLLKIVGVLVVLAQVLEVWVAIHLVHTVDHPLGEAGQLGAGQRRDHREKRDRAG